MKRLVIIGSVLLVLASVAGWAIGNQRSLPTVRSAMVYSSGNISTLPIDGWTYAIPLDVSWTDAAGSFHDHGRPDCLPPATGPIGPITFASVDVSAGGFSWRPVVWVSCRQ